MGTLDYIVLAVYFLIMIAIGMYCAKRNKKQEDYFMGGRGFGKLMQTFAAFGAGTGPQDPINTGSFTYSSGMNGMWGTMYWLFVTPFYWITGVWYRRMRHLTLGDWFVERYESKKLGGAYAIFGVTFFMIYGSMFFSAISKTAAPMIIEGGGDSVSLLGREWELQYLLVPAVGIIVLLYGMIGGLAAAYFTDLIQGICIIALSCMLIPIGLNRLSSNQELNPTGASGLEVLADQLPDSFFEIIGNSAAEFSVFFLIAIIFSNLVGVVVQPHFIATGGGSAKTENDARIGLVVGNFLKRFCTLGWVLTGLIAATLYADAPELIADPDQAWGYASMRLLEPGLRGLMLACLLAALMSSVDAYMIVGAGLIVRNLYVPFIQPTASEKECLWVGRLTGTLVVAGSIFFSLAIYDMISQLTLTFWFPLVFAAPFWIGMYWRRASTTSAWITVGYCLMFFSVIPFFGPMLIPGLKTNETLLARTTMTQTVSHDLLSNLTLRKQYAKSLQAWKAKYKKANPLKKEQLIRVAPRKISATKIAIPDILYQEQVELEVGVSRVQSSVIRGGDAIFWKTISPQDSALQPQIVSKYQIDPYTTEYELDYPADTKFKAGGNLKLNLVFFLPLGIDLAAQTNSTRSALELIPKIVMPFLVMIFCSWITSLIGMSNSQKALNRYYAKMKTPVDPDPEKDRLKLEAAYADPGNTERVKLFPNSKLEIQKPTFADIFGFTLSVLVCFGIIALAFVIAGIGG